MLDDDGPGGGSSDDTTAAMGTHAGPGQRDAGSGPRDLAETPPR
jgi:hypothetical protein